MEKRRRVTITEIFCDVCGDKCGSYSNRKDAAGNKLHACLSYNEKYEKQCFAVLDERLLAEAIARRDAERFEKIK